MGKKENMLKDFQENAKEEDIKKIQSNLSAMNKGKIKNIWPKVQALYKMAKDPEAAWTSKAMAIASLLYLISPADAMPDIVPVAGLADDVTVIVATVATLGMQLNKYLIEYKKETMEIEKKAMCEIEEEKGRIHRENMLQVEREKLEIAAELEAKNREYKEKFIFRTIGLLGIIGIIIVLLLKLL
ncbi:YkvA family protein [Anaeromicrobium sediminis]|uniref:DUF1232 domain-containing protein n=1 Tax=Anaeromicrobium sediminis TaxID=1478221 RepID=A0A267MMT4_9FIRM|nr:YkvA family protein [Anaeromicrobium sediminis]PAB60747.1 hypothetical protein CCE28_04205 [Anaeromicrobium sediminis]